MRRIRIVGALLLLAGALAAVAGAAESPQALRRAIVAATRSQGSFHYETVNPAPTGTTDYIGDIAQGKGVQRVLIAAGNVRAAVTIVVVRKTAYVRGDALALRGVIGLTKAQASRGAGKWISITPRSKFYAPTIVDVTIPAFMHNFSLAGRLTRFTATVKGRKVVGVRGAEAKGKNANVKVVRAQAAGKPLPTGVDIISSGQVVSRTTIGNWNERVRAEAPAHATPIAQILHGGGGPLA